MRGNLLTRDQPPQSPQGWEHWFLQVTRKAIKADYLVHHDTPSAARSNRTHLVHDTCHRSRNQPRTARNTVMQQTNSTALAACLGRVRGNVHARS